MHNLIPSNICSAFEPTGVIGSKVINHAEFHRVLQQVVAAHDFTKERVPGQAYLPIPDATPFVSSGVGKRILDPSAYVLREYRGQVSAFLRREHAAPVTTCAAVVYTLQAYLSDPDVTPEEVERIHSTGTENLSAEAETFVIVTVLASSGQPSQLSPHRFVANLAGGNKEALVWTADEIRAKAVEILAYENDWMTVADLV